MISFRDNITNTDYKYNPDTIFFNYNIEQNLLSIFLRDPSLISELVLHLSEEDFWAENNRSLFTIMKTLYNGASEAPEEVVLTKFKESLPLVTLDDILSSIAKKDTQAAKNISREFLHRLSGIEVPEENRFNYYDELLRLSTLRKIESLVQDKQNLLRTKTDIDLDIFLSQFEAQLMDTKKTNANQEFQKVDEVALGFINDLREKAQNGSKIDGVGSGFEALDRLTNGFKAGELIIIAARPAMGKTAFALNVASNAAIQFGKKVLFFSLEMSSEQLIGRVLAAESDVFGEKFKHTDELSQEDWLNIQATISTKLANAPLFIDDATTSSIEEVLWKARRIKKAQGLDMIVVDYLQLLNSKAKGAESRQNEVSRISRALKQISRELGIPVIALSQLSRAVEQREDKRPLLSDLRESGAIEQDADMIMFLYRDSYYNKKKLNQKDEDPQNFGVFSELLVSKNRHGSTGKINLRFKLKTSKFVDAEDFYTFDNKEF
ncbi:replicative DNA helicase [Mycoplasma sp. Ms02]|uniref:replicative DNA helicase n=1 Tax=Mycoplasma sp. Ms02 TaxID=353851 RepID=UPI001C8A3204|nr:replicative DNA helicase [Mycoplasma sp. Ms02]QZE12363.1 replicative DNA helicase [Mycoplasma sp. Ms02]